MKNCAGKLIVFYLFLSLSNCHILANVNCTLPDGSGWIGPAKLYQTYDDKALDIYWDYANRELFLRGLDAWWVGSERRLRIYGGDIELQMCQV